MGTYETGTILNREASMEMADQCIDTQFYRGAGSMWDLVVRCLGNSRERKSKLASPFENGFCPPFWGVKLRNVS